MERSVTSVNISTYSSFICTKFRHFHLTMESNFFLASSAVYVLVRPSLLYVTWEKLVTSENNYLSYLSAD